MISAGRVLIKPRGEWNVETTYHILDLVNHNGYAWLSKRTVVGIEPSNDAKDYWHNMLDIEKIVAEAMAGTLAEEVSELLKDEMSEARYVTDLLSEFDVPTFVYWDAKTVNTPYSEGLTKIAHGYALAEGNCLTAWADGETFTYGANGWDKVITSLGSTMTGALKLGSGKGAVSADDEGTYIEAVKDAENYRRVKVENPSGDVALEDAVKFVSAENGEKREFGLFGEHNTEKIAEQGYAKIYSGTYTGTGTYGKSNPKSLTFPFVPKVVMISAGTRTMIAINGCTSAGVFVAADYGSNDVSVTWNDKTLSWYSAVNAAEQLNVSGRVYTYVAWG